MFKVEDLVLVTKTQRIKLAFSVITCCNHLQMYFYISKLSIISVKITFLMKVLSLPI